MAVPVNCVVGDGAEWTSHNGGACCGVGGVDGGARQSTALNPPEGWSKYRVGLTGSSVIPTQTLNQPGVRQLLSTAAHAPCGSVSIPTSTPASALQSLVSRRRWQPSRTDLYAVLHRPSCPLDRRTSMPPDLTPTWALLKSLWMALQNT